MAYKAQMNYAEEAKMAYDKAQVLEAEGRIREAIILFIKAFKLNPALDGSSSEPVSSPEREAEWLKVNKFIAKTHGLKTRNHFDSRPEPQKDSDGRLSFYNSAVWHTPREVEMMCTPENCFASNAPSSIKLTYAHLIALPIEMFVWHGPTATHCQLNAFETDSGCSNRACMGLGSEGIGRFGLAWALPPEVNLDEEVKVRMKEEITKLVASNVSNSSSGNTHRIDNCTGSCTSSAPQSSCESSVVVPSLPPSPPYLHSKYNQSETKHSVRSLLRMVERAFVAEAEASGCQPGAIGLQRYVPGAVNAYSGAAVDDPGM